MTDDPDPICSARGCTRVATIALRWNNPKIHPPDRRKTWLACPDHQEHLSDYLSVRGLLREVVPVDEVPDHDVRDPES
ncbi:MAG: hypothetical protein ACRDPG_08020 [Nocardioidaceae bacterium]